MKLRIVALLFLALTSVQAVILFRTGVPSENTTKPGGLLDKSGWQYEGQWGGFLGTPIAPHFFISAKHIGNAGAGIFNFGDFPGVNYTVVEQFDDPFTDFTIWRVSETFPSFAPLYATPDEIGRPLVVIGRGTQRGVDALVNNMVHGWKWGGGDGVQRWGENIVTAIVPDGPLNQYVYATFDQNGLTNEAHLSAGDSGGAVFIQDNGTWKLAGINYAVDGPFFPDSSGAGAFNAALFDARDFYSADGTVIAGPVPLPTGFYATRVSSKLDWIFSVVDPAGDSVGNGVPNLARYARNLNSPAPVGLSATMPTKGDTSITLTYRKLVTSGLQYQIEKSSDLAVWTMTSSQDQVVTTVGNVQTIEATVPSDSSPMFLRLLITQ